MVVVRLPESIEPELGDRRALALRSLDTPMLLEHSGGCMELYSNGKLLKQFDKSDARRVHIKRDGKGIRVVEPFGLMPFEAKRDIIQAVPAMENRWPSR